MSAKAQGRGKRQIDLGLTGLIGHVIQVALRVGLLIADGGRHKPSFTANTLAMASTAPAAPSIWPVMDLVEDTMHLWAASSPKAFLMAFVSQESFKGVLVP